jgi:hypothetical protein
MTESRTPSRLSDVLDALWQSPKERRNIARRVVESLTETSRLILAAWDTAALFGPIGGRLDLSFPGSFTISDGWGKPFLTAEIALSSEVSAGAPLLLFSDTSWAVLHKSGDFFPSATHKHSVASLLMAMQLIRDHLSSTLLKPAEMRHRELESFALQVDLDAEHFRRLAAWFPHITTLD